MGIRNASTKAFSLIELVIVIGIIGLVIPVIFGIFFMLMQQQVRINILSETKRQGDNAMAIMQNLVRNNAYEIRDPSNPTTVLCANVGDTFTGKRLRFTDKYNRYFELYETADNKIASYSSDVYLPAPAAAKDIELTNTKTTTNGLFSLSCIRKSKYSTPLVKINYNLTSADGSVNLDYRTSIKMKNY